MIWELDLNNAIIFLKTHHQHDFLIYHILEVN